MPLDQAAVQAVLQDFKDPESGRSVVATKQVRDIALAAGKLSLTLELTTHSAPIKDETREALAALLRSRLPELSDVQINLAEHTRPPIPLGQIGLTAKSVIAVGSGKGGVGKSTIAASLAIGLKRLGAKVGLMDADVYGPSIPHLMGVSGRLQMGEDRKVQPIYADGLPCVSIGFLVEPGEPIVWRGPMLHGAVQQFLRDTAWGELDYLIIDMPPGTGDIAITLSQLLPLTGAVVVCTPQDVALLDAVKAIGMFRKVNIPVLGMVENMSYFICPDNGKQYNIFGHGGARAKAEEMNVPFLGEVPINIAIRENGDSGKTIDNFSKPEVAPYLEKIVKTLVRNRALSTSAKPPMPSLPVLG